MAKKTKKKPRLGSHPTKEKIELPQIRNTSKDKSEKQSATKAGLQPGWTRATVILRDKYFDKLKALGYWDRTSIKDHLDKALAEYLKNKRIKPLPSK